MLLRYLAAGLFVAVTLLINGCGHRCCRPSCPTAVVSSAPPCCPAPVPVAPVQSFSPPAPCN
jgi:hypothetical protein